MYSLFFHFNSPTSLQIAVLGGLVDRFHDLLLCGADPAAVDLSLPLDTLLRNPYQLGRVNEAVVGEMQWLVRMSSALWRPSRHAYLYGPEMRGCIASLCLVQV